MLFKTLAIAGLALAGLTISRPASALPIVERGDLNQHCVTRYQPRGIQAVADPYAGPMVGSLRCRLIAPTGYTIENQSPEEVCTRLTGNSSWTADANLVRCTGVIAAPRVNVAPLNVPRRCTWVRSGAGYLCR
jgi:hypothetical protein